MNYKQRFRFNMFLRVRQFGIDNAAFFPVGSYGANQLAQLNEVIELVETTFANQATGFGDSRFAFINKDIAREKLRDSLRVIARTARAMRFEYPGYEVKFRLPRKLSDQSLLSTARAFYNETQDINSEFTVYGMSPTFRNELNGLINLFELSFAKTGAAIDEQVEATAEIEPAVKRGMTAVKVLNGIVRNLYRNDIGKLAAWTSASRIEKAPKKEKPAPPIFQEDEILI